MKSLQKLLGKKVNCKKCGHYSIIKSDSGNIVEGCSIFSLMDSDLDKSAMIEDGSKKINYSFEHIDTTFMLNREGDCKYHLPQTDSHKKQIKEFNKNNK